MWKSVVVSVSPFPAFLPLFFFVGIGKPVLGYPFGGSASVGVVTDVLEEDECKLGL